MADNLIEEVNDDLRRQKLEQFWKENGSWIIAGAVLAVLATAALTFWRGYEYKRDMAETAAFSAVVKSADAAKIAAFAEKTDKDHALQARFAAAALHVARKENDAAAGLYAAIAKTRGVDRAYRDLASLLGIGLRLDKGTAADLRKELEPLTDKKSMWRFQALELEALLAVREGNKKAAADILTQISGNPEAPQDVRTRAFTLRELYMADLAAAQKQGR